MSVPSSAVASTQHALSDNMRPFASFAPSISGDIFLQYASQSTDVNDNEKQRAQILKEELKMMFQSSIYQNIEKKLNLIDLVQRFGVSYHFQQEINQALEQIHNTFTKDNIIREEVNHKSVSRFDARYHMTLYQQDPSHNKTLLTFAKMDFNILQKLHQKEIGSITEWWKKADFVRNVPFARDRLVESYIWSLTMSYKPEHSCERMFAGKVFSVLTLLDDAYDAYGTVQELELFTQAFERWDISLIESLPQSMKVVFDALVKLCEEIESMTTENGKSTFVVAYFKQAIFYLIKGYMVEARWCHDGYIPTYDEYKANELLTVGVLISIISFISPGEFATKDVFEWIFSNPNIIEAVSVIGRFLDDMGSHKFEQERVHVASVVECCMKQYDISQAEAYNLIHKDVDNCWKVINEQCLQSNDMIPKFVFDCVVNLARSFEFIYGGHQNKFTNGELLKHYVSSLLVDPLCFH